MINGIIEKFKKLSINGKITANTVFILATACTLALVLIAFNSSLVADKSMQATYPVI